jgi:hypothetical protein
VRRRRFLSIGAVLAILFGTPAPASAAEQIEVTPNGDLVDGQLVTVSGTIDRGFTLLEIFQCRADPIDEMDCDLDNSDFIDIGSGGLFSYVGFMADARIYTMGGDEVDCRAAPGACVVGVGFALDADEALTAPLVFDPTAPLLAPVTASVEPSSGLVDGQVVRVQGRNLSDRSETFVYQCPTGAELGVECFFDDAAFARAVSEDGSVDLEFTVRATLVPARGPSIDCTSAPGACDVRVSWGLSTAPDREVRVPISFGVEPLPTAPTTATTAVATGVAPTATPRFAG